jgi:pantoate--beta-alanine ligase
VRTIREVAELRSALDAPKRAGQRIGLVPTMGAFHEGHLSLMRQARAQCDEVVVSLFVNPAQFNDPSDLQAYPRDEARDAALAAEIGVDCLFIPSQAEVYPRGFATTVSVSGLTDRLEGVHRGRAHFDGVTTVVTKLFNMVAPDVAYFGQKDAQQALVIKRLVRDLDLPVRIEVCPIIREADGLAMSSRNVRLSPGDRARAAALQRSLRAVEAAVAAGERDPVRAIAGGMAELSAADIEPEYLELVGADSVAPVRRLDGDVLVVVAAKVGATRLIDNHMIKLPNGAAIGDGAIVPAVTGAAATRAGDLESVHHATRTFSPL